MIFKKTLGPNGTVTTMVSWKAGSREVLPRSLGGLLFCSTAWPKRWSKGCLFEKNENRKWYPRPTFYKSSALGPSKNDPGERFWKNMKKSWKNYRKINGFWLSKTIEKYWKQIFSLIFGHSQKQCKNDAKGDLKRHVFCSKMATWASQVRLILWFVSFWCDANKWWFWDALPLVQKIWIFVRFRTCLLWNRHYFGPAGSPGRHPFRTRDAQGKDTS